MNQDPYRVLGLARSASQAEIKAKYRKLAQEFHPDRRPGDRQAENRFKDVSNAYGLLSDATNRRKFDAGEIDAHGKAYTQNNTDGYERYKRNTSSSKHSGFRDASEGPKKNRFNNFFRDRSSIKAKGADISYTVKVSFTEAARGGDKSIRLATGKTLKVSIPTGTKNGQVLRLKGQGMNGIGGGLAGDALVEINIVEDNVFRCEGHDVHCEEAVTLSEALLGGRIQARTIDGQVIVTVPEGSNSGTRLRLKGRGLKHPRSSVRGDHYVTLKVVLPKKGDNDLKTFVKKWSARNPYSVRNETLNSTAAE